MQKGLLNWLGYFLAFGLFMQVLIFPGILKPLKLPFLGLIVIAAILNYSLEKKIFLHKYTIILVGLYLLRSIIGIIVGYSNNTPGLYILIPLNVYYVVLYLLIISLVKTEGFFYKIIEILFMGTVMIVFLDIYYILASLGFLPQLSVFSIFDNSNYPFSFGINQYGTLEMYARNLGFLPVCFPLFTGMLIFNPKGINKWLINKVSLIILLLSTIVLMFLTGRRIFLLIILVTPVFVFLLSRLLKGQVLKDVNKIFTYVSGLTIIFSFVFFTYWSESLFLDFDKLKDSFVAAFDSSQEGVRFHQSESLIYNWKKAPLLGHGMGAGVPGYKKPGKDRAVPWGFELSYHSRLNQYGIIGFGFEALYYFFIVVLGCYIVRRDNDMFMIAILAGYLAFLLANATNPFLNSFEFFWPVILPLIYINIKLFKNKKDLEIA